MKRCAVADLVDSECSGRIQWHHVWTYAGRQIDEAWAIVGVCEYHHEQVNGNGTVRQACQLASLELATPEDLAKYPRMTWYHLKAILQRRFAIKL